MSKPRTTAILLADKFVGYGAVIGSDPDQDVAEEIKLVMAPIPPPRTNWVKNRTPRGTTKGDINCRKFLKVKKTRKKTAICGFRRTRSVP